MTYGGCLLAVKDMDISKEFFVNVLDQKVMIDMGQHVTLEGGFSLQQDYSQLIGLQKEDIIQKAHDFQLYFEVGDLDSVKVRLQNIRGLKILHDIKEYAWGQRSIRLYDPDMHIIEVAESIEIVVKRYAKQGLSLEDISKRTMFPIEFVQQCL